MPGAKSGLWHRFTRAYQIAGVMLLNTLVILVAIELGATVILRRSSREAKDAPLAEQIEAFKQKQLSLSYYRGQDWSRAYWDEHMQIVDHWDYQPYTIWRTRPFDGDYINVDQNGIRYTPGSDCGADSFRVFAFGGSTMWGYGAPDWGTIPAYLQAGLSEIDDNICVVNHGEVAYNSTQSLIKLMRELQRGDVPDMVIFYDGANEVTTANVTGQSGSHFYLDQIQNAIQGNVAFGSPEDEAAKASPLAELIAQTATYRLLRSAIAAPESGNNGYALPPYSDDFIDSIAQVYLTNIHIARMLADEYGFDFLAFWQPVLVMKDKPATDEEQRFLWEMPGGLPELFRAVYARIEDAAKTNDHLYDIADILNHREGDLWIDFNHLTPPGNQIVAGEMLKIMTTELTPANG